jgi:hypothetical protein
MLAKPPSGGSDAIGVAMTFGQVSEPIAWQRSTWRDPVIAPIVAANPTLPFAIALLGNRLVRRGVTRNGFGTVGG